jgi:molybdenum cofactor guanylyltransferase
MDAFVLAGGRSRRMGRDKARVAYGTVPLAVACALPLRRFGRVAIVRRGDDGLPWVWPDGSPVEVILEPDDRPHHPLWGVATALEAAQTELVAVVACDVPDLTEADWAALVERAPAVAVDEEGRVNPLVAVLPAAAAAEARALAGAGASARALVERAARVPIASARLGDHDDPSRLPADPVARLLARVPVQDPSLRERIAAGERARLRARGIVTEEP